MGDNEVDYTEIANIAVEIAQKYDVYLDFTTESIQNLENWLGQIWEEFQQEKPTDQYVWHLSIIMGIYLGETLLRKELQKVGYAWYIGENKIPVLAKDGNNTMSPITKVEKRLINGIEDNVKSFYDIAVLIGQDKFPLNR